MTKLPRQTVFSGPATFLPQKPTGETVFVHSVHFRMKPEAGQDIRDEALRLMVKMCETPGVGILDYTVAESQDIRKGHILHELVIFASEADLTEFKESPGYSAYVGFIPKWADWDVADYHLPLAALRHVV